MNGDGVGGALEVRVRKIAFKIAFIVWLGLVCYHNPAADLLLDIREKSLSLSVFLAKSSVTTGDNVLSRRHRPIREEKPTRFT